MKEIPLSRGLVAIVDDEDFDWLNQWKWSASKMGTKALPMFYAVRTIWKDGKTVEVIPMHRLIMKAQKGQVVDHINRNPLDNQKANLRLCSQADNSLNRVANKDGTSKFKGVCWISSRKKWEVSFRGKFVGRYDSETEAARAYNEAAASYSPEFSRLNVLEEIE